MFTIESFCNSIWETSCSRVLQGVSKGDYKEFALAKKGGTRTINYLEKDSKLWGLQQRLLINFLDKQDLPVCVKGFRKGESYYSFLSEHIGAKYYLRVDIESFFHPLPMIVSKMDSHLSLFAIHLKRRASCLIWFAILLH